MTTAPEILQAGIGHMQNRAATYDKPEGERSMAATVAAFNAVTGDGRMDTEERGWLFQLLLKAVRSQQGAFKLDNYEDGAAYFGLMGEAAATSLRNPAVAALGGCHGMLRAKLSTDQVGARSLVLGGQAGRSFVPAGDFDEQRADIIGQNGNTGEHYCECHACIDEFKLGEQTSVGWLPLSSTKMILCPTCGNKRCPHASDHRLECTNSNEPGQPGSVYPGMTLTLPTKVEPERPRHLCQTCAQGHATHECTAGNDPLPLGELAIQQGGKPLEEEPPAPVVAKPAAKPELPPTDHLVDPSGKPSWDDAPAWAMWLTQDAGGTWIFWKNRPDIRGSAWFSMGSAQTFNSGEVVGNWRESLEEAPGHFVSGGKA